MPRPDAHLPLPFRANPASSPTRPTAQSRAAAPNRAAPRAVLLAWPTAPDRAAELPSRAALDVAPALRAAVLDKVTQAVHFARRHWNTPFRMPAVGFACRGATAGIADSTHWCIQVNAVLLAENPGEMLADTTLHEVAHLLTRALHGGEARAHGPQWKAVMRALGASPRRTHQMDVSNAVVGEVVFRWQCGCGQWPLLPRRHARFVSMSQVVCKKCRQPAVFSGEVRRGGIWRKEAHAPAGAASRAAAPTVAAPIAAATTAAAAIAAATAGAVSPGSWPGSPTAVSASSTSAGTLGRAMPTERQLGYARDIARRRGLVIPERTVGDRGLLSRWIDWANAGARGAAPSAP